MKSSIKIIRLTIMLFVSAIGFTSCVDKEFDEITTANVDPDLVPTHTIKELQTLATGQNEIEITSDIIVAGIVVGDDRTGNIYKKIIIQQDSSGIALHVDNSSYYTDYPVGRKIFIKCKGLFIAKINDNIDLGTYSSESDQVGRIPSGLIRQYVVKGKWGQYVEPMVFTIAQAASSPLSIPRYTLVKFNDVEFEIGGTVYATDGNYNLDIEDCAANPNTIILYTSAFSTFALTRTPFGRGSITGVYSIYNGDAELQIRDLNDVVMNEPRCDGPTATLELMPLDSVRLLDPGAGNVSALPINKKIIVTVTSDYSTNMLGGGGRNVYVQDNTAGIQIRFDDPHTFQLGTILEINVSAQEISTFNGVYQINNVPLISAIPIGFNPALPRVTTIADALANYDTWEGQIVRFDSVTITGTGTYSGINFLNDGPNSIELYTTPSATFASSAYPTGPVSVTGILTEFNGTKEVLMRNLQDVQ